METLPKGYFEDIEKPLSIEEGHNILEEAEDKNISYSCAWDIFYLKMSGKWQYQIEQALIQAYKDGNPPADLAKFAELYRKR